MGLDNPLHIVFLVVILLLVFGAKRLPEIGRSLGTGMREFKDSVTGGASESTLTASTEHQQPAPPAQQAPVQQAPAPAPPVQSPVPVPAAAEPAREAEPQHQA
jgi:sec-independent protein translocase protein TatA